MARSVADVVLVRGEFAAVPAMVAEGRKILRNVQRVAKLFVTKSAFAAFLVLSIGLTPTAYPLLPRQLTLAASLTIGIPGFFLALAPELRPLQRARLPARARPLRAAGRHRRRARRPLQLPVRAQRARPQARRRPNGRRHRARPRRPLPDPRARGRRTCARHRRLRALPPAADRLRARPARPLRARLLRARRARPGRARASARRRGTRDRRARRARRPLHPRGRSARRASPARTFPAPPRRVTDAGPGSATTSPRARSRRRPHRRGTGTIWFCAASDTVADEPSADARRLARRACSAAVKAARPSGPGHLGMHAGHLATTRRRCRRRSQPA